GRDHHAGDGECGDCPATWAFDVTGHWSLILIRPSVRNCWQSWSCVANTCLSRSREGNGNEPSFFGSGQSVRPLPRMHWANCRSFVISAAGTSWFSDVWGSLASIDAQASSAAFGGSWVPAGMAHPPSSCCTGSG